MHGLALLVLAQQAGDLGDWGAPQKDLGSTGFLVALWLPLRARRRLLVADALVVRLVRLLQRLILPQLLSLLLHHLLPKLLAVLLAGLGLLLLLLRVLVHLRHGSPDLGGLLRVGGPLDGEHPRPPISALDAQQRPFALRVKSWILSRQVVASERMLRMLCRGRTRGGAREVSDWSLDWSRSRSVATGVCATALARSFRFSRLGSARPRR